jgi:hypothetical protein
VVSITYEHEARRHSYELLAQAFDLHADDARALSQTAPGR